MSADEGAPAGSGEHERRERDEDRGGIIGWFYRRYQDYDKWSGRYDWFNWLLSLFKTHTAAVVATSSAAAVAVGGTVVLVNPELREKWVPESWLGQPAGDETVATERWGSSVVFPIEGKDLADKEAAFHVAVLPEDLTWAHKSSSILSQGGRMIDEAELTERVFTSELRVGLERSSEIMAIGLASQEGQQEEEVERARRRGETAARWLGEIFDDGRPIWFLNLGQYQGNCEASGDTAGTAWQRPLIVVGIRSQEEGVKLDEAFADAISDQDQSAKPRLLYEFRSDADTVGAWAERSCQ